MPKVSTRSRKSATTGAATAVAVPPSEADTAQPIESEAPPVITVAKTALGLVELALKDHAGAREPGAVSIHGQTLVELAERTLQRCVQVAVRDDSDDCDLLYEVAALLQGADALDRIDAPASVKRHAITRDAFQLVDAAATSYGLTRGPCEDLADGIKAARRAHKAPAASAASTVAAFTPQQIELVFEMIAAQAETMRELWRRTGKLQSADYLAGRAVISSIGAMADQMIGGQHLGSIGSWMTGDGIEPGGEA